MLRRVAQFFRSSAFQRELQEQRNLSFATECLESRVLLAGNVIVRDLAGMLSVTGDDLANEIQISETLDNRYVITPLSGTTVNGSSDAFTTRVYENEPALVVRLRSGDDFAALTNLSDMRAVLVDAGAGGDELTLTNVETRLRTSINTGDGNDSVTLSQVEAKGSFAVNLGGGNDSLIATNIDGTLGRILAGPGDNVITMENADFIRFNFVGGQGSDDVTLSGLQSEIELVASFNLGEGNDTLSISSFQATTLNVNAGTGDDSVIVGSPTQVSVRSVFSGGPGQADALNLAGLSSARVPTVLGFETVTGV